MAFQTDHSSCNVENGAEWDRVDVGRLISTPSVFPVRGDGSLARVVVRKTEKSGYI